MTALNEIYNGEVVNEVVHSISYLATQSARGDGAVPACCVIQLLNLLSDFLLATWESTDLLPVHQSIANAAIHRHTRRRH